MESLLQDIRYGLRLFLRSPAFTLIAILTLALGVGLNGAVFSVVNLLLFRQLPLNLVNEPERIVLLFSENQQQGLTKRPASLDLLGDLQKSGSFSAVAGGYRVRPTLTGVQMPVRLDGYRVTAGFFSLLGVRPALGRAFLPAEDLPGRDRVVMLSHRLWQEEFGGDPAILRRSIRLDGVEHQIVGVMPPKFYMPRPELDLFLPLGVAPGERSRADRFLLAFGRLAPGVTLERAQAEMDSLSRQLAQQYPDVQRDWRVQVRSINEELQGSGVLVTAMALLIAVSLVLLLACSNVGSLLLARAMSRKREVALRLALGANRMRLVRQLLTEGVLLAAFGGVLGLFVALLGARLLGRIMPPGPFQLVGEMGVDANMLAFLALVSLLSAMVFGLIPALQTSRPNLTDSLKEGSTKATIGRQSRRTLDAIVVGEIALSLVLLVGAGLMVRTMKNWRSVNEGYDPDRLLTWRLDLPPLRYGEPHQVRSFAARLQERLSVLPGVEAVGVASTFPASPGKPVQNFLIDGKTEGNQQPWGQLVTAAPGYLESLGIPILEGRSITAQDREDGARSIVLSKALAEHYWSGESPLGKRIRLTGAGEDAGEWFTVVGVAGNVEHYNVHIGPMPILYVPLEQRPERALAVAVRTTAADPETMTDEVRRTILELDSELPVDQLRSMGAVVEDNFMVLRMITSLLSAFGVVALVLAAIGIYGVISYLVSQRFHEIGIRMALGAARRDVLWLVLSQTGKLALLGIALGLVGSMGLTRMMAGLLYGVGTMDPVTLGSVAPVLLLVALLASFIPGRRASRVEPMIALRYQ